MSDIHSTRITILGANGFIGRHLQEELANRGYDCHCPGRGEEFRSKENLGHVIYSIGVTADFRSRPFETLQAHVGKLARVLQECTMDSLLYLSSTRVYGWGRNTSTSEESDLIVNPLNPSDLYNLSKAMGESICLASSQNVKIARLSNVYGRDFESKNFLTAIIEEVLETDNLVLRTSLDSTKDYISVARAVDILIKILLNGKSKIYNVATGFNTSHRELVEKLQDLTGCFVHVEPDAPLVDFPEISTSKIDLEFGLCTRPSVVEDLESLVRLFSMKQRSAS